MMKKLLAFTAIVILAMVAWVSIVGTPDTLVTIGDEDFDGPLGAFLGLLFAGGGMIIAGVAMTFAAVIVGAVFAGLGIMMVFGMALLAVILAAIIAPFTLPLLIPVGIVWWIVRRNNKRKALMLEHAA